MPRPAPRLPRTLGTARRPLGPLCQSAPHAPPAPAPAKRRRQRRLRRMARRCRTDEFARLAQEARARVPDINLTTDIIAGFPGETEAEWRQTPGFRGVHRLRPGPHLPLLPPPRYQGRQPARSGPRRGQKGAQPGDVRVGMPHEGRYLRPLPGPADQPPAGRPPGQRPGRRPPRLHTPLFARTCPPNGGKTLPTNCRRSN